MTRIGIVGGGPAATLHAEAVRMEPTLDLIGVSGRGGAAARLATALQVEDLALEDLARRADAIVVAVPPAATTGIVQAVGDDVAALLIESPLATTVADAAALSVTAPVMTAANLLHAAATRRALRAIAEMAEPHHLELRSRGPRPHWGAHGLPAFGGGTLLDPMARLLPVLLAATGTAVETIAAEVTIDDEIDTAARLTLALSDGRRARADVAWTPGDARTQLEVADRTGVVSLELLPRPRLERDGQPEPAPSREEPSLAALGFVDQVRRLAAVARGEATPWPDQSVGIGAVTIAAAAAKSAREGGEAVTWSEADAEKSPGEILSER